MWFKKYFAAESRLSKLEEDLSTLKRQFREQSLDFDALYDKVRHTMSRVAKRAAVVESETAGLSEEAGGAPMSGSPLSPSFSRLTPRQRTIQLQILERRKAASNGG